VRILGIDPGTRITGWGIISGSVDKPIVVSCGSIVLKGSEALAVRLARLTGALTSILREWQPDEAAVEAPFAGVNARSALQLAHARGAILATLGTADLVVHEYAPAAVKKTVTGHGRAEKQQMQSMIARLMPTSADDIHRSEDLADALAVALCHGIHARYAGRVEAALQRRS
jgi:crossover junction endodeoxyribonuclease RuvC